MVQRLVHIVARPLVTPKRGYWFSDMRPIRLGDCLLRSCNPSILTVIRRCSMFDENRNISYFSDSLIVSWNIVGSMGFLKNYFDYSNMRVSQNKVQFNWYNSLVRLAINSWNWMLIRIILLIYSVNWMKSFRYLHKSSALNISISYMCLLVNRRYVIWSYDLIKYAETLNEKIYFISWYLATLPSEAIRKRV